MAPSRAHAILREADVKPHLGDYWVMSDFDQEGFEERAGEEVEEWLETHPRWRFSSPRPTPHG